MMHFFKMADKEETQVKECLCCWYDLLGYGTPFVESKWNLYDKRCKENIERLGLIFDIFHGTWTKTCSGVTKLFFNDGAICNFDIDNTDDSIPSMLYFLDAIFVDFDRINSFDIRNGFPGVRGVLTYGHRFHCDDIDSTFDVVSKRTIEYFPKEFQMNTAFSKAYIMEESGSRMGVKGANLYIDESVFHFIARAFGNSKEHTITFSMEHNLLLVEIRYCNQWILSIYVDPQKTPYSHRGIETNLYRFVKMRSWFEEQAKQEAHDAAYRYLLMEQMDEELYNK